MKLSFTIMYLAPSLQQIEKSILGEKSEKVYDLHQLECKS